MRRTEASTTIKVTSFKVTHEAQKKEAEASVFT